MQCCRNSKCKTMNKDITYSVAVNTRTLNSNNKPKIVNGRTVIQNASTITIMSFTVLAFFSSCRLMAFSCETICWARSLIRALCLNMATATPKYAKAVRSIDRNTHPATTRIAIFCPSPGHFVMQTLRPFTCLSTFMTNPIGSGTSR